MENFTEILYTSLAIMFFCLAVSLCILLNKNLDRSTTVVKENQIMNQNLTTANGTTTQDVDLYSRDQLIAYVMSGLEYNTEIDGIVYEASEQGYQNFNYHAVYSEYYKLTRKYDSTGNVTRYVFTSVEGKEAET